VENWQSELQLEWQDQLNDLVTAIACQPNGEGWAASSGAGQIIWNPGQMDLIELAAGDGRSIDSIAFSADSRWLAAGGQAGELLIWNCDDSNLLPQLVSKIEVGKWIEHLVWHPIESHLAISYGSIVKVWDIPKATEISTWKLDRTSIFDLAWHPAGSDIAMSGAKGVQLWAYRGSKAPIRLIEVSTATIAMRWDRTGCYLAAGNLDRTVTIVDRQNPDNCWTLTGCPGKIRQMVWLEDTTTPCLAVASGTAIVLWHLSSDSISWNGQMIESHQDIVAALAAHPSLPILASGSADGYGCLWSEQGEIQQIITDGISKFTTLQWHPQHQYLVTGSQTGSIDLWAIPA
jgi:WD40 repeat protein